jgi:hypothetical protein
MKTISSEQFKNTYGEHAVSLFDKEQNNVEPSFLQETGEDIAQIGTDIASSAQNRLGSFSSGVKALLEGKQSIPETIFQTGGQTAGFISDIFGSVIKGGVKAVLPQSAETAIKTGLGSALEPVVNTDLVKGVIEKYNSLDERTKRNVDSALGLVSLATDVATVGGGKKLSETAIKTGVEQVLSKGEKIAEKSIKPLISSTETAVKKTIEDTPASIMNRVARLDPTKLNEFKRLSGKNIGQYLVDTGNYGAPDKIILKESQKFVQSKKMVDEQLAQLPGVYKDGSIADALTELNKKVSIVSSDNVSAPFKGQVQDLIKKYNAGGLTMNEINQAKGLFEREVKLGYKGVGAQINAPAVEKATYIDKAIHDWQVKKAGDLGFKNIADINRQTQLSKFIINELGKKTIGQSALNNIGLTDWIVLAGGSPEAVAGFLTKKFFSSRAVQAKVAEMLNIGKPVNELITPVYQPTIENAFRKVWPSGTPLQLTEGTSPVKQVNIPIELRGQSTIEPPAQIINRQ